MRSEKISMRLENLCVSLKRLAQECCGQSYFVCNYGYSGYQSQKIRKVFSYQLNFKALVPRVNYEGYTAKFVIHCTGTVLIRHEAVAVAFTLLQTKIFYRWKERICYRLPCDPKKTS